jgi:ribose 5-phosphate isomerase B
MKIVIASDHAGFEAKRALTTLLNQKGYQIDDVGPNEYNKEDDYPDFVIPAMKRLQSNPDSMGIIMCKNGVGVSMLANKYKGVRAALCFHKKQAETSRTDDNANVLALPIDFLSDEDIWDIVDTFLKTDFSGFDRHSRRLKKVSLVEEENFK